MCAPLNKKLLNAYEHHTKDVEKCTLSVYMVDWEQLIKLVLQRDSPGYRDDFPLQGDSTTLWSSMLASFL